MKILYDFRCDSCDIKEEHLVESNITSLSCSCGGVQHRLISAPRISLPGWDTGFPTAASKWERQHEKAGGISE